MKKYFFSSIRKVLEKKVPKFAASKVGKFQNQLT